MILAGVSQSAEQRTKRRKGKPTTQTFLWLYLMPKNVHVEGYESSDSKKEIWGEIDRKRENRRFASILKKIDALERKLYVLLSKEGQSIPAVHLRNEHNTPKPKHFDPVFPQLSTKDRCSGYNSNKYYKNRGWSACGYVARMLNSSQQTKDNPYL